MLNYAGVVKSKDAEPVSRRLAASEFPGPRPHTPLLK